MDSWLRPNRRALVVACLPWVLIYLVAAAVATQGASHGGWYVLASLLAALGTFGWVANIWAMRSPRVGYADGELLLFLRDNRPVRLPVDVVECFFLGQGPSGLPGGRPSEDLESRNVVVRLAERATEWHHGHVRPELGHWCDGYITITGTWCEPIDAEVVGHMNHRLAEVKRQRQHDARSPAVAE